MKSSLARQGARLLQSALPVRAAPTASRAATSAWTQDVSYTPTRQRLASSANGVRHLATASDTSNKSASQKQSSIAASSPSTATSSSRVSASSEAESDEDDVRLPRSVQAVYMRPLRRRAEHGLPACDLQLRSYSVRNLEFFADFAMRAAYYLKLPASGPVPLPKKIQRWTVSKSPFVHKKSKETFERVTLRRLIQIKDAHPEAVQVWLAYLRKHAYFGVGMKANVWEHVPLDMGKTVHVDANELRKALDEEWSKFGRLKTVDPTETIVKDMQRDS